MQEIMCLLPWCLDMWVPHPVMFFGQKLAFGVFFAALISSVSLCFLIGCWLLYLTHLERCLEELAKTPFIISSHGNPLLGHNMRQVRQCACLSIVLMGAVEESAASIRSGQKSRAPKYGEYSPLCRGTLNSPSLGGFLWSPTVCKCADHHPVHVKHNFQ